MISKLFFSFSKFVNLFFPHLSLCTFNGHCIEHHLYKLKYCQNKFSKLIYLTIPTHPCLSPEQVNELDASSRSHQQSALGAKNRDEHGVAFWSEASESVRNKGSGYQLEQGHQWISA